MKPSTHFSNFFQNASEKEKRKFFLKIIKKVNQEQRSVLMLADGYPYCEKCKEPAHCKSCIDVWLKLYAKR